MNVGEKVPGKIPPHGGSWEYDDKKDELTLVEAPTEEAPAAGQTEAPTVAPTTEKE